MLTLSIPNNEETVKSRRRHIELGESLEVIRRWFDFMEFHFAYKSSQSENIRWNNKIHWNVLLYLLEAEKCYVFDQYLSSIGMSSSAVEMAMNQDPRMQDLRSASRFNWLTLSSSNLIEALSRGLPVQKLLNVDESNYLGRSEFQPVFVLRRNKLVHGDIESYSTIREENLKVDLIDYDLGYIPAPGGAFIYHLAGEAIDQLRKAQDFLIALSNQEDRKSCFTFLDFLLLTAKNSFPIKYIQRPGGSVVRKRIKNLILTLGQLSAYPREWQRFFHQWELINIASEEFEGREKIRKIEAVGDTLQGMWDENLRILTQKLVSLECVEDKETEKPIWYVIRATQYLRATVNMNSQQICQKCPVPTRSECKEKQAYKTYRPSDLEIKSLFIIIYQIRRNLFHGNKKEFLPHEGSEASRNWELVRVSNDILNYIISNVKKA